MAKTTSIEWCDHTWTPVVGCDAISPACANCSAATRRAIVRAAAALARESSLREHSSLSEQIQEK